MRPGVLTDAGRLLLLKAATPSGRRAINDPGEGAPIPLEAPLSYAEAMEGVFDIVGFGIHIGRVMLRAARDGGIILFTLRAPRDPEPHHILSVPAQVDDRGVMSFHLGTLQEMEAAPGTPPPTGTAWPCSTSPSPTPTSWPRPAPTARRDSTPTASWRWRSRSSSASSNPVTPSPWALDTPAAGRLRRGLIRADPG